MKKRNKTKNIILLTITMLAFALCVVASFSILTESIVVKLAAIAVAVVCYAWIMLFVCSNVFRLGERK